MRTLGKSTRGREFETNQIRHRKNLHLKISQGGDRGDRGDRMNFSQDGWQKFDKSTLNNCFYDSTVASFIGLETSSVMLR